MPLSDIVTINISLNTTPISQVGFGIPLILSRSAAWAERVRSYTSLTGVVADFGTTTPEYRAAAAMFAQNPAPAKIMIGRCANKVAQKWRITPTAVNSVKYRVVVDGQNADYTSDGSATVAEITAGLKLAIDALGLAVTTLDNTTSLDITANVAGVWHSVKPDEAAGNQPLASLMAVAQTHADAGVAADLTAILAENSDWYAICHNFNSSAEVAAIAAWAESNSKFYVAATQDTLVASQALGVGTDIAQTLKTSAYARTALLFHPDNAAFADAAWLGSRLPSDPGSETWAFAQLAGVAAVQITATHLTNITAKYANYFYSVGGKNITFPGKVSGNQYVDVIRGRDWLAARLQTRYFSLLTGPAKVPYTDKGIAAAESETRAQMIEGIRQGFLADSPKPTVAVPKLADVSATDKTNRALNGVSFSATIQGAIHQLAVTGTLSA